MAFGQPKQNAGKKAAKPPQERAKSQPNLLQPQAPCRPVALHSPSVPALPPSNDLFTGHNEGTPAQVFCSPPSDQQQLLIQWNLLPQVSSCVDLPRTCRSPLQDKTLDASSWQGTIQDETLDPGLEVLIASKFDAVINSIDEEQFSGEERELVIDESFQSGLRGGWGSRQASRGANRAISTAILSTNVFDKVNSYANSRLPPNLPPLKLYLPSFPLLCLAAQYSLRVYDKPTRNEREAHVDANWRLGTKAMVIKSLPLDEMNLVVIGIRGSQTFMDWAVNLHSAPVSPVDFLEDPGNLCHSGFLSVARKMIRPVAARLRFLLEENPSRTSYSLLFTGHSAGGAVASLLYTHMLSDNVKSELSILTGCFKRIHCVAFGAPPLSLLPLTKPSMQRHEKSLFISFINEGDPVPRADKAYVRSLLSLYATPGPGSGCVTNLLPTVPRPSKLMRYKKPNVRPIMSQPAMAAQQRVWSVPPNELSNAGRLVVLRGSLNAAEGMESGVQAQLTCDQELRAVVFGNPVMHMMKVYARRVEVLATKAVTAQIFG